MKEWAPSADDRRVATLVSPYRKMIGNTLAHYRSFGPAPDGERFLMVVPTTQEAWTEASGPRILIVLNRVEELKARVLAP